MYKNRSETIGLHDQLYETKILSLLNFRAQHDEDIEEFYLATNVDLIGEFADICFRAKVKGFAKEIAINIQTKHTETDKVLSLSINHDLARYLESYLKMRRAFNTENTDKLFGGSFSETECLFVLYTNAEYDFNNDLIETEYTAKLKELIGTSQTGSYLQPTNENEDVRFLYKIIMEEEMAALAEHFAKLLNKEVFMIDELVLCYHYILAQKVFEIPDIIHDGHRIVSFRESFFDTKEHFVLIFKNTLYEQVLLRREIDMPQILNLIEKFFSRSSDVEVLSELIGTVIAYKNGKFEFIKNMPEELKRQLNEVSVPQSTVDEAIDQAARKILEHSTFKVPLSFGNKDLTISGDDAEVESRLNQLTSKIVGLINDADAKPNNALSVINIEESLGDELLEVDGGLAGAVSNVFVPLGYSKLMKFADNIESIKGDLAKRLYLKLQKEILNLRKYAIMVKVKKFPKLSFHSGDHDVNLVKDFLSKLFFFTSQSNEKEIADILKREMGYPYNGIHLFQVKAEAVLLKYHDAIQEWFVKPGTAEYLTKHSKQFENATKDIINQPLISVINIINKFKLQKVKYTFNVAAVRSFKLLLDEQCNANINVIVTDNCKLTVAKLTTYLNNEKHVVLDLESISNLFPKDYKTLRTELTECKETIIFVNYENWCERFNDIVKAVTARSFIITKAKPDKILNHVNDFGNNLMDLSVESQQTFLKNTKVIFQGKELALDLFVKDENAMKLIKGDMFEHTIFKIGLPISNQTYDDFKDFYTDRRVSRIKKTAEDTFHEVKDKVIRTLHDLQDHVILITAMPGMGKSTLLTHLSIKTKESDPNAWIVRINLLEYSKIFSKWQKDKTVIDPMLSLHFMCFVALGVAEEDITAKLETENNVVSLKYCSGDASITFGFEMFLHFYNSGTLMFLFDGFDEIFPHYANEALSLLKSVRSYPRQHKIWITSRSFNHIKDILEQEFERSYEIEPFSDVEQKTYLKKFWIKRSLKDNDRSDYLEPVKCIKTFAPCHRPVYYSGEDKKLPSFKLYYTFIDILKAELDGYVDEANIIPVDSNTLRQVNYANDLFATPLHLCIAAESLDTIRWIGMTDDGTYAHDHDGKQIIIYYMKVMAFEFFQHFVEAKLKRICFTENNNIDPCNLDTLTFERKRAHFITKHKKLGAYAVFCPDVDLIFNDNELKEVMETIEMLKLGTEKSSFIHSVEGDIPLFIHKLIAEYFAAEYIYDLLESDVTDETRELIIGLSKKGEVYNILASKRVSESRHLV